MDTKLSDKVAILRPLLQKAVRQGNEDLVFTTSALLEGLSRKKKNWFRTHTAIITFEECWPLGAELIINSRFYSKVAALIRATRASKAKDATGLGYMGYSLSKGDRSVLNNSGEDKHIIILADAVRRPEDFWIWVASHIKEEMDCRLLENATRFRNAGLPRDKAVIQAAAYLFIYKGIQQIEAAPLLQKKAFPFWAALDMHTRQGRRVLRAIARELFVPLEQLEWVHFFFEGAAMNQMSPSPWWDRMCQWHFRKVGLAAEEAHLLWEPVKPQIEAALHEEGIQLHRELYEWKLSNLERIDELKRQVEIFLDRIETGAGTDQMELFR